MRYRLESDPDIDASYTAVTTRTMLGITMPFFDITTVDPGTYVLHTYLTSDGTGTGNKVTIVVQCDDGV
jgi:choline-glycine betaine transporter